MKRNSLQVVGVLEEEKEKEPENLLKEIMAGNLPRLPSPLTLGKGFCFI